VEITLITDQMDHIYQPGFLFIATDQATPERFYRTQNEVTTKNVKLVIDKAVSIDREKRMITTQSGSQISYDYLVIATGSHPDLEAIPGFKDIGYSFYTKEEALRLRKALTEFNGGRIVIGVGVPHKCPVAPLEITFMLDDLFRQRNIRDRVEIVYTYPIGRLHSLKPVADWVPAQFDKRNIKYETFFNVASVDPDKKIVKSLEGGEQKFDLFIFVPPHKGAKVIRDSKLGDADGFVPTDKYTLKMRGDDRIYVIGDTTDLPISKAGSTAHYEADIIVENIIREIDGLPPTQHYDGKVFCFIETSLTEATYVWFDYKTPPKPTEPSQMLYWYKLAFNSTYWLAVRGLL
ncbi:MAG: NAD(P)/FAD-dependent oxidoreductase, partial [bacterium]